MAMEMPSKESPLASTKTTRIASDRKGWAADLYNDLGGDREKDTDGDRSDGRDN